MISSGRNVLQVKVIKVSSCKQGERESRGRHVIAVSRPRVRVSGSRDLGSWRANHVTSCVVASNAAPDPLLDHQCGPGYEQIRGKQCGEGLAVVRSSRIPGAGPTESGFLRLCVCVQ